MISLSIFVATSVVVALFGVVPLPEYEDLTSDNKMSGKLIYHVEIQSENIIPPAPDILDSCIFYIDLSNKSLIENPIVCSSDLYELSYDIYFYDAQIYEEQNIILYYWDYESSNDRKALIVDITSGKIVEQGSHAYLLKQNGIYSNFWKRQSGGFINFIDAAE